MDIEQFNKLAQEHRICVCRCCGTALESQAGQRYETGEVVRCPACFQTFVPFPERKL